MAAMGEVNADLVGAPGLEPAAHQADRLARAEHVTKANRLEPEARQALADLGRQALHAALLGFRHPRTFVPAAGRRACPTRRSYGVSAAMSRAMSAGGGLSARPSPISGARRCTPRSSASAIPAAARRCGSRARNVRAGAFVPAAGRRACPTRRSYGVSAAMSRAMSHAANRHGRTKRPLAR
jgi:hypothetical protein